VEDKMKLSFQENHFSLYYIFPLKS